MKSPSHLTCNSSRHESEAAGWASKVQPTVSVPRKNREVSHVTPTGKTNSGDAAHYGRGWRQTTASLWLRQDQGVRSFSAARRLSQRAPGGLHGRFSVASSSRD